MTPQSRTALGMVGIVAAMGALSFAAVPFYDWFCRTTGFAGTTQQVSADDVTPIDRTVVVRFVGAVEKGFPWEFHPVQTKMTVRLGETNLAYFEASNPTDHPLAGQAVFNVVPYEAGGFFDKIQCFCFTQQVLQPGETIQMPVSFYVDPAMLEDPEARLVHEITLGYTFYQEPLPEPEQAHAALEPGDGAEPLTVPPQAAID